MSKQYYIAANGPFTAELKHTRSKDHDYYVVERDGNKAEIPQDLFDLLFKEEAASGKNS